MVQVCKVQTTNIIIIYILHFTPQNNGRNAIGRVHNFIACY